MGKYFKHSISVSTVLVAIALSSTAKAQVDETDSTITEEASKSSGGLSEIVVTAQKREQNAQSVGIAITALGSESLVRLQMVAATDLARVASNVTLSGSYGGQMSQFTIRGVTQNDFNDHVEPVIAVYVDEGYVAFANSQGAGMFDLDHVEVLKGPQGTLFGRNSTGGLVQLVTKKPTDFVDGYVDATIASYNNVRLEGALGGPITDSIRGRIAGYFERYDGWVKNKYPEETFVPAEFQSGLGTAGDLPGKGADLAGIKGQWAIRGQVEADLSDSVDFWASAYYTKMIASTGPYQQVPTVAILDADGNQINEIYASPTNICQAIQDGVCVHGLYAPGDPAGTTRPVPGADYYGYLDPDGSGPITSSDYAFDNADTSASYGANVKFTVDLGSDITFTSFSDYKHFDKDFSLDLEAGPQNQFFWHGISDEDSFSQELRLNGRSGDLTWVTGAYFLKIKNASTHGIGALPGSSYPFPAWDQPRIARLDSKSYSLFGQVEYTISPSLAVIGGLRGSREVKDYDFEVLFVYPNTGLDPFHFDYAPTAEFPGFYQDPYHDHSSETLWNWKAQLNWTPADRLLFYAGVTQGAKAGSYNSGGPMDVESIPYKAERLISYEVGVKSELFDRKIRLNAAAFYYDYHDYQAARWLGVSSQILNAEAYIYGGEVELTAVPSDTLEISLNGGYQKSLVEDVPVGAGLKDVHTTFAPNFTLSGYVRYTLPQEIAGGQLALQVSGNYQSSVWHNLNNFDANKLDAWGILNLRGEWTSPDERFRFAVFANNVLNNYYDTIGFDTAQLNGSNLVAQGKPRWIGANLRYSFGQ